MLIFFVIRKGRKWVGSVKFSGEKLYLKDRREKREGVIGNFDIFSEEDIYIFIFV